MWAAVLALAAASPAGLPADNTPVVSILEKLDMECWQKSCSSVALSCAGADPICRKRLEQCVPPKFDGDDIRRASFETCYKGLSFSELRPGENDLFKCAHQKGCVQPAVRPEAVQSMSLLEEYEQPNVMAGEHGADAHGIDMRKFLAALEQMEGARLDHIRAEAASEGEAKLKIATAAGKLEELYKKNDSSLALDQLDRLDASLSKAQADLDEHELASRETLASPPLSMVLEAMRDPPPGKGSKSIVEQAFDPKDIKARALLPAKPSSLLETEAASTPFDKPSSLLEWKRAVRSLLQQKRAAEAEEEEEYRRRGEEHEHKRKRAAPGTEADLERTPALGMHESLAQFVEGLHGDTPELLKVAERQRKKDMAPLARERAHAFEKSYLEEMRRLGKPAKRAQAVAALRAGRSSLVEGPGKLSQGTKAIEDTMKKIADFKMQMNKDFGKVNGVDQNLRQDVA
jgi:hypothetical protein